MIDLIADDPKRLTIRWISRTELTVRWIHKTHLYFCMPRKIIKPANKMTYNMNFILSSSLDIRYY